MPLFEQEKQHIPSSLLRDKYGWPPFSILNTISWDWQRRRDEWEKVIGDSTLGRDIGRNNATPTNTFSARGASAKTAESISEFDPYLCELMYRWFSREGDYILDPFAGGCTRGVVASVLGRQYDGIDLSKDQVEADWSQFISIGHRYKGIRGAPKWICGDSAEVLTDGDCSYNMVFTCPPYYNLEKYTDNPNDLSNLPSYSDFLNKYAQILRMSADMLVSNSFFVIVVSEIRESAHDITRSGYLGLVPDTINILRQAGLTYYDEIILENNIGSLPIRAPKYFDRSRKIGRHHQNILVFYKGDLSSIETKFGPVGL